MDEIVGELSSTGFEEKKEGSQPMIGRMLLAYEMMIKTPQLGMSVEGEVKTSNCWTARGIPVCIFSNRAQR